MDQPAGPNYYALAGPRCQAPHRKGTRRREQERQHEDGPTQFPLGMPTGIAPRDRTSASVPPRDHAAALVPQGTHRREHERQHEVAHLAVAQRLHTAVVAALGAAVPRKVVVGAVAVALEGATCDPIVKCDSPYTRSRQKKSGFGCCFT